MKNWFLRLHRFATQTDKMAHVFIFLTFTVGISAKFFPENTPINNTLDMLEIIFFIAATVTYVKYINR